MKHFIAAIALLSTGLVLAAPSLSNRFPFVVKEEHSPSPQWLRTSRAPSSHKFNLRIALKQHGFEELERHLYEISDPDHARYGQWLEHDDVHSLVSPHAETTEAVQAWLKGSGIEEWTQSPAGDWLYIPVSVGQVEQLLDTEYHVYKHEHTGNELIRTPKYSLPAHLHEHIDMIAPTNYFGDIEAQKVAFKIVPGDDIDPDRSYIPTSYKWARPKSFGPSNGQSRPNNSGPPNGYGPPKGYGPPNGYGPPKGYGLPELSSPPVNVSGVCVQNAVTSLCLRTLYKTVDYVPQVPQQNLVAMTAYLNESANISDFHVYLSRQRQDASLDYTFNVTSINDGINFQGREPPEFFRVRDLEANLDSQTIGGIVYPSRFQVYSTGGSPPFSPDVSTPENTNEPYLDWLANLLSLPRSELPNTVSTSYSDSEQTVPYNYAARVCQEFAQLTSRGVTLLFSSGDNGVGPNGTCFSNDGTDTPRFLPNFPPSCPYVTAVGGTRDFQPEIVAFDVRNGYISGSGVSNYFQRPQWQDRAYNAYNGQIGALHAGLYNTTGRAYPDVAAQGFRYVIVYGGQNVFLDGTSCSAPTVTGILSLVNDALLAAGRPTLGFLNPWLYKYGWRAFNDVVNGSTWGCETSGFPAMAGWDLASGWGTPDFLKLKQIALSGPPPAVFNKGPFGH